MLAEEEWSTARSLNPTDAARIKLFLRVYNYGTATASNIIPSFTLRIGNRNVAATLPPGYLWQGTEVIRAANVRAYELVLTAEVEARGDYPVETVYLDLLESDEARIYLARLGDREHLWTCSLPDGYHTPNYRELVVAINDRGFAASSGVTERVNVHGAGDAYIYFQRHEYYNHTWRTPVVTGFYVRTMVGSTVNPDWYPEADFGPYAEYQHPDSGYSDGFWHPSNILDWVNVYWSPATDYATPTVGLKISGTLWHGLTLSDLALMHPVMYQDLKTNNAKVGDAIVSYLEPYFLKAIITGISHTYTEDPRGWRIDHYDHYDFDHTVTVSIRYVIIAKDWSECR